MLKRYNIDLYSLVDLWDIYIYILRKTMIPKHISGFGNLNWLVRVNSTEEFRLLMASRDIPIDSNVYLYSGNISHFLTLHDVYRAAPHLDLRQEDCDVRELEIIWSCSGWRCAEFGARTSASSPHRRTSWSSGPTWAGSSSGELQRPSHLSPRLSLQVRSCPEVRCGGREITGRSLSTSSMEMSGKVSRRPRTSPSPWLAQWITTGARGWPTVPGTEW